MRITNVEHRDIFVNLEFSLEELNQILNFLSFAQVNYDSEEYPEMAESAKFVSEELFPMLNEFVNKIEEQRKG